MTGGCTYSNRVTCPEIPMVVCVHHGPTVPLDSVAALSSQQCITVPLARPMKDKMMAELDDPNWVFVMASMACMDPSGEYFAVDTWSMYLGDKQLYQCPISEANIVIATCCMM